MILRCFTSYQTAGASSKIYLINCLSTMQQPLLGQEVSAKYANNLSSIIEMQANVLLEKEVNAILRRCGLSSKISYIQNLTNVGDDEHKPLSEVEEMSPQVLSECLRTFLRLVMGNDGSLPKLNSCKCLSCDWVHVFMLLGLFRKLTRCFMKLSPTLEIGH